MKALIFLFLIPLVTSDYFKETQNFKYSRTSPDDGEKKGFYEAQSGNMGGNYEVSKNMDTVAQTQLHDLKHQVGKQLGMNSHTMGAGVSETGGPASVYGSASTSGTVKGSTADLDTQRLTDGHYDTANAYNSNQRGYVNRNTAGSSRVSTQASGMSTHATEDDYDDSQRIIGTDTANSGRHSSGSYQTANNYDARTAGSQRASGNKYYATSSGVGTQDQSNIRYEPGPYIPKSSGAQDSAVSGSQYYGGSRSFHTTSQSESQGGDAQRTSHVYVPVRVVPADSITTLQGRTGSQSERGYESTHNSGSTVVRPGVNVGLRPVIYQEPARTNYGRTSESHIATENKNFENSETSFSQDAQERTVNVRPGDKVRVVVRPNTPVKIQLPVQASRTDRTYVDQGIDSESHIREAQSWRDVNTGNVNTNQESQPSGRRPYQSTHSHQQGWEKQSSTGSAGYVSPTTDDRTTGNLHSASPNRNLDIDNQGSATYNSGNRYSSTGRTYGSSSQTQQGGSQSNFRAGTTDQREQDAYNAGVTGGIDGNLHTTQPKSYQSSYSYQKSWEKHGTPYQILPSGERVPITSDSQLAHGYGDNSRTGDMEASATHDQSRYVAGQQSASTSHSSGAQYGSTHGSTQSTNLDESMNTQMRAMQGRLQNEMNKMCTDCGPSGTKTKGYSAQYSYSAQRGYGGAEEAHLHDNRDIESHRFKRSTSNTLREKRNPSSPLRDLEKQIEELNKEIDSFMQTYANFENKHYRHSNIYDLDQHPSDFFDLRQKTMNSRPEHHSPSYYWDSHHLMDFDQYDPPYHSILGASIPDHIAVVEEPQIMSHFVLVYPVDDCDHDDSESNKDKEHENEVRPKEEDYQNPKLEVEHVDSADTHVGQEIEDMGEDIERHVMSHPDNFKQKPSILEILTPKAELQLHNSRKPIQSYRQPTVIRRQTERNDYQPDYIGQQREYEQLNYMNQQTQDFGQHTYDFGQQTQDLGQQTEDFGKPYSSVYEPSSNLQLGFKPKQETYNPSPQNGKLDKEVSNAEIQNVGQQTHYIGQQTEIMGQQTEDNGQQTEDMGQQTEDMGQQTEYMGQQTEHGQQQYEETHKNNKFRLTSGLQLGSSKPKAQSHTQDDYYEQKLENVGQQTEDIGQQTEDMTQQTEDMGQQTEDVGQQVYNLNNPSSGVSGVMQENEYFGHKAMKEQYGHQDMDMPHSSIYVSHKKDTTTPIPKSDDFYKHHGKTQEEEVQLNNHLQDILKQLSGRQFDNDGHTTVSKLDVIKNDKPRNERPHQIEENNEKANWHVGMEVSTDNREEDNSSDQVIQEVTKPTRKLEVADQIKATTETTTPQQRNDDWFDQHSFLDIHRPVNREQKDADEDGGQQVQQNVWEDLGQQTIQENSHYREPKEHNVNPPYNKPSDNPIRGDKTQYSGNFDTDDGQQVQQNVWEDLGQQTLQESGNYQDNGQQTVNANLNDKRQPNQIDLGQQQTLDLNVNSQLNVGSDDTQQTIIDKATVQEVNKEEVVPTTPKTGFWTRTKDKMKGWFS